jgi:hypothetical protein
LTYRFVFQDGKTFVTKIENIASLNVDRILQNEALNGFSFWGRAPERA